MKKLHDRFEKFNDEFLAFERVETKRSQRPDLHAFLLLDELFPGNTDMVCSAQHDEIWLEVDNQQLATLSDDQLIELIRCGVRHDGYGACMFV